MNNFTSLLSFKSRSQETPLIDEFMPTREEAVYLPGLITETDIFEYHLAAIIAKSAMQYVPKHRSEAPKHRGEPVVENPTQQMDQVAGARSNVAEAFEE